MSNNIKSLAAKETFTMDVLHPVTGEPMLNSANEPMTVTILGPGTKAAAKVNARRSERMIKRIREKGKTKLTPEEQQAEAVADLSEVTVSINGFDYEGGTDAPAIKAMYADTTMGWLTEQVAKASGDWANFM